MTSSLDESLSFFKDKISDCIKSKKSISVITKALIRAGAKCTVRTSKEFSQNVINSLKEDSRDFHIVTDLGGGFSNNLDQTLGEDWIVLDHHQISENEHDNPRVINAWKYGIDGGTEICAGGMAYLAAMSLDEKTRSG
jgi:RecJ-like exonuclease